MVSGSLVKEERSREVGGSGRHAVIYGSAREESLPWIFFSRSTPLLFTLLLRWTMC